MTAQRAPAEGALRAALARELPAGWRLRERESADLEFLATLYLSTREEELRPVAWAGEQKTAFLRDQFELQHAHYLAHYPRAQWLVIEGPEGPAGRIYVEQTAVELRLMDVALLPAHRGRGIGGALLEGLLSHADACGVPVSLHVEPFNRAAGMYGRHGFVLRETRGAYQFMERPVPVARAS